MRPVQRGPEPLVDTSSRAPDQRKRTPNTQFARAGYVVASRVESGSGKKDSYSLYRGPLIASWGKYCSYCEIVMASGLHIEHKAPKANAPDTGFYNATAWSNMLLACPTCNSAKGQHPNPDASPPETPDQYVWPDVDACFCPNPAYSSFQYVQIEQITITLKGRDQFNAIVTGPNRPVSLVVVRPGNRDPIAAARVIEMLKLNGKYNRTTNSLDFHTSDSDMRIFHRTRAWLFALNATQRLQAINQLSGSPGFQQLRARMENQIMSTMYSTGFWSVWLTVFYQELTANRLTPAAPDTPQQLVRRLFVEGRPALALGFPGTSLPRIGLYQLGDLV